MNNIRLVFLTFMIFPSFLQGQDTLHFSLSDANNIIIQGILNGSDSLDLMFHTAASGMTLTTEAIQKIESWKVARLDTVSSWGGQSTSAFSQGNTLELGSIKIEEIGIWENKNSGPGTDGKFGPALINAQLLEINFEKRILILHRELPAYVAGFKAQNFVHENGFWFVEADTKLGDQSLKNRFLVHSGYGGSVLYDDAFSSEHKMGDQLDILEESQLSDSYGNILKTKKAKLPAFEIADFVLTDLSVSFFEGSIGRQKMSVIGGNLLKQFNWIFDLEQQKVYLQAING